MMWLRLNQVKVNLDYDMKGLKKAVSRKLCCPPGLIGQLQIVRRSIDARKKQQAPFYSMVLEVEFKGTHLNRKVKMGDVKTIEAPEAFQWNPKAVQHDGPRPVVVGAGPAGLMATYYLASVGLKPILLERGGTAEERAPIVDQFWTDGTHDPENNVLYGEGGAGLFSDGKLTARSKDNVRMEAFFRTLIECGAPEDILYDALPHVGSDALQKIVPQWRQRIIEAGGEIRFHQRFEGLISENGELTEIMVNGEALACTSLILAIGHSARDTYQQLFDGGLAMEPKAFAVGVRVEMPQDAVNQAQYGEWCNVASLGAASFKLTRREENQVRGCYSFCMCPGGMVIPCASEPNYLTSNGMSLMARDLPFANAAFLVPVTPEDFPKTEPKAFGGITFQREWEGKANDLSQGTYKQPAMRLTEFLNDTFSGTIPESRSFGYSVAADLKEVLPGFVVKTLKEQIPAMLAKLRGVKVEDVLLYGPETRSSSPVRLLRGADHESVSIKGVFPAGEGAGYAGGIVSSAVDGLKAAEALTLKLQS